MNMDLNSLARTLAERLTLDVAELPDRTSPEDWPEAMLITDSELRQMAEAVIREAIEKTLEAAEQAVDDLRRTESYGLISLDANGDAKGAIRSLKQSNSGMEVRK